MTLKQAVTALFSRSRVSPNNALTDALHEASRREQEMHQRGKLVSAIHTLTHELVISQAREASFREDYTERAAELIEAKQMAGVGPWLVAESRGSVDGGQQLRESQPISSQGAFGDLELALQNVDWRREVNLSWLEFSRWGIQQIILISRLYYIKNPIIRRLIDVDAYYVFGRGCEISSPDETANAILADFRERNKAVIGQVALSEHQKRTNYDGNLFFCFFFDSQNSGQTNLRLIDATEMQDIITDPDDVTIERLYRRKWSQRDFEPVPGITKAVMRETWYPALGYVPTEKPDKINGVPVDWDHPVLHRKFGAVGQWVFGCPVIYPALDWAKAARRFLEACATVKQALSQIAMTITTKGGQQAIEGIKQQLETTVGPNAPIWDSNPTPVNASIFASGPGTVLQAFSTKGAGGDPAEVKQFITMCAIVIGVPPTFLGDLDTANLATATTLDRPTELGFMHKQEAWKEILVTIARAVLDASKAAPSGMLRESITENKLEPKDVRVVEMAKVRKTDGTCVYLTEAQRSKLARKNVIEVRADFPSIREGDNQTMVAAVVEAMTLGNKQGQVVGIDEREGVRQLFRLCGIEDGDEILDQMYPESGPDAYHPVRKDEPEPEPSPAPGAGNDPTPAQQRAKVKEAANRVMAALREFIVAG